MTEEEAIAILEPLLDGIDPDTGESFDPDHVCNAPVVMRALYHGIMALREAPLSATPAGTKEKSKRVLPERAGASWTAAEDDELRRLYLTETPMPEICSHFQRTRGAITSRLVKLKLLERKQQYVSGEVYWSREMLQQLAALYHAGMSVQALAQHFGCTEEKIHGRLFYMGLRKDAPMKLKEDT